MSISATLSNANSGLAAASKRASVLSNNVANALTPGFARREVGVSERVVAGQGAGVVVDGVSRATDPALTRERRSAESALTRDSTVATTYASFNTALGEPGDAFSLFTQYQNLETSFRSLAETPESQPLQAQVLDAAKSLVNSFNQLASQVTTTREDADGRIAQEVDGVNAVLKQIAQLNDDISAVSAGGGDAAALEDQRKRLIDDVSKVIPVKEVSRDNNKVDLITNEGIFLIAAGSPREIEFTRATSIDANTSFENGTLSGLSIEGSDLTPGGDGSFSLRQGTLAGLFEVRDKIAPGFQTQIDGLSRDLIERFEGIDASLPAGSPGLFTDAGAAFDPANETGLAGRLEINAIVDPDQGGNVWRLRDGLGASSQGAAGNADFIRTMLDSLTALRAPPAGTGLSGQLSAANMVADVTSSIGASRISAETRLSSSSARAQSVIDAETAATGVDTDQELQRLLLVEQAYAANARVIQTADQLLRRLLEL